MDSQTNILKKKPKAGSTLWKRILFLLSIGVYFVVAGFIYHEWIVSLRPSPDRQASEAQARTNDINYKYFTEAGLQYYRNQEHAKAELAFRKALEYAPDEALAYNNLGSALNAEGKWDEAILILAKSLSLDPTLTIAKNNLDYAKAEKAKMHRQK